MAQQVIYTDANELNLLLKDKMGRESHIVNASDVQRISFSHYEEKKLFGLLKEKGRRITIVCKGIGNLEFDEPRHKEFFETYLTELRAFCRENRVTFYDFS